MKKLLLVLAVAAVAVAVVIPGASAGGWATVGLSSLPPTGLKADQSWPVDITVLQHGRTPLAGVTPVVRIRDGKNRVVKSFTATATDSDLPANTLTYTLAGTVPTGASITAAAATCSRGCAPWFGEASASVRPS